MKKFGVFLVRYWVLIGVVLFVGAILGLVWVSGKGDKGAVSQGSASVPKSDPAISSGDDAKLDGEREADLLAVQRQLESYFEQFGKYPTLANMNDAEFRATYMGRLGEAELKDPEATDDVKGFTANPEQGHYAYKTEPNGCDNSGVNCSGYTLLAYLSSGEALIKTALN